MVLLDTLSLSGSFSQQLLYSVVFLFLIGHITYTYALHRDIPGPFLAKFTDLWRLLTVWRQDSHWTYLRLHKKHGDLVRVGPNCISICKPDLIPSIYGIGKGYVKSDFYAVWQNFIQGERTASMVFIQDESQHATTKKPVAHAYSLSTLKEFEPLLDSTTAVFLSRLDELFAETGDVCDLGKWLQWYAFDVIGELTFSKRLGFLEKAQDVEGIIASVWENFCTCATLGQMPWVDEATRKNPIYVKFLSSPTPSPIVAFGQRRYQDRLDGKDLDGEQEHPEIKDPALEDKVINGVLPEKPDFLSRFLDLHEEDPDAVPIKRLLAYLFTNINAGSDTIASTLRAVFYHLLKNPESQADLVKELQDAHKDGKLSLPLPTWEEGQKLPYLNAVIKEALRVNPALSLPLERIVPADGAGLRIDDEHVIPPGTIVGINPWILHRDPRIFGDDAEKWNPRRWLSDDEDQVKYMDSHILSFGAGKRTCLGRHIAMLELTKLVPALWIRYEIELADPKKDWKTYSAWGVRQVGWDVKLKRREVKD